MADGRSKAEWDQTAVLACALYNAIRDPKRKRQPFTIADFHPFESRGAGGGFYCHNCS